MLVMRTVQGTKRKRSEIGTTFCAKRNCNMKCMVGGLGDMHSSQHRQLSQCAKDLSFKLDQMFAVKDPIYRVTMNTNLHCLG